jgi:hypothetical protein
MDAQSAAKLPFNLKILPVSEEGIPNGIPFIAMFNPDNLTIKESIAWDKSQGEGKEGADPKYKHTKPRTFTLEITLDGTGVNTNGVKIPVTAQVLLFRQATTSLVGDTHRPNYLIVQYGLFICSCCLESSSVSYTMFDMFGLPIRAKITAEFTERTPAALGSILNMLSSPDLTHEVTVQQWDILPLLTHKTYKKQEYYLQVAKANKLKNFRKLKAGTVLKFPPISKQ